MSRPARTIDHTAEVLADLIERIAEDKATKLRSLAKCTVVMAITPEWMRREEVNAYFGLPVNQLYAMVLDGKVNAKKTDPDNRGSATIYKVADIRKAIEGMTDYRDWKRMAGITGIGNDEDDEEAMA